MFRLIAVLLALAGWLASAPASARGRLTVEGERFVLVLPDGKRLTSADLVGAELLGEDGRTIRIDAIEPARERPDILLYRFSVRAAGGAWQPLCEPDSFGRTAGFPVAGRWDRAGRYVRDPRRWFVACSGGARGKCVLWGYDPWKAGPGGEDLTRYYRACQFAVRADYAGNGVAHTRDGTPIELADNAGVRRFSRASGPGFVFEAGWSETGAVCVARPRWPDLPVPPLRTPRARDACTPDSARRQGALILTRVPRR